MAGISPNRAPRRHPMLPSPDATEKEVLQSGESHALVPVWVLMAAIVFAGRVGILVDDTYGEPPSPAAWALLVTPYAVAASGTMFVRTRTFALGAIVGAAGVIGGIGVPLAFVFGPFMYIGAAMNGGRETRSTTGVLAFVVLHAALAAAALSVMRRTIPIAERLSTGGVGIALGFLGAMGALLVLVSL